MKTRELTFEGVAFGGEALARDDGRVVFVPFGLPGEHARVALVEQKRDYARGEIQELLVSSEARAAPPCPYFGTCGGCNWQHANYHAQLVFKRDVVAEQLRRVGRFDAAEQFVKFPIGMVSPWNYRNQARFSVGWKNGELCFTMRHSRRRIRIDHCWISHPLINDALERIQGTLAGVRLHQLTVRVGANTGQRLIAPSLPHLPELATGQEYLEEELLGRRYRITAQAFFQVNTRRELRPMPEAIQNTHLPTAKDGVSMAELLALLVMDRLEPGRADFVIDAYCGVGTFSALMAPLVGHVVGIEEAPAAVEDARRNAADLANAEFTTGKVESILPELGRRPDAVILDPARVGCHPRVLQALIDARPGRLIYVSCDPATLARDLRILVDGGFQLCEVQPLDMFPQTYHVECVATLVH